MVREHWLETSQAIGDVAGRWKESKRFKHGTALIARVYLWAAAHNCAVSWACEKQNWDKASRPEELPGQSTMSRRARTKGFEKFLAAVGKRLDGKKTASLLHLRRADGKPLTVAAHSKDHDAKFGRGAGQKARGYKLHVIWSKSPMPDQWCVTALNVAEKHMINRMVKRLDGCGYLLADGHYDHSDLHDAAAANNHQLVAPRQHPGKDLGHHYQSPHRKRCIQMLEIPANINTFGRKLFGHRKQIERDFGNLTGYSGGLICLPPWIRRPWRVRHWTHAKLLLNAARIRCVRRRKAVGA
jgi:Transposase DDE domain